MRGDGGIVDIMNSLWRRVASAMRDKDLAALSALELESQQKTTSVKGPVLNALAAQFRSAKGDDSGALELLAKAARERALVPEEQLIMGFLVIDDPARAHGLFRAAAKELDDPRTWEGLGITLVDLGKVGAGIKMLERAVQRDRASWSARYALGVARATAGRSAEALEDFEAVAKMRPNYEPAWLGLAAQAIAAGRAAEASVVLGRLVRAAPGREKLLLAYVDCLVHAGELPQALQTLTPYANSSRDPKLLIAYATLCLKGEFIGQARLMLAKIRRLAPAHALAAFPSDPGFEGQTARQLSSQLSQYRQALT
jgi:tetratricopeptide (TPR) repeat protein